MAGPAPALTPQQQQQMAIQANLAARRACIAQGVDMIQSIYTNTFTNYTNGQNSVINIPIRNVGLIKRFYVEVQATITGTSAGPTHTLTPFGPSNFFSQIIFSDLSNQQRINTAGWHLTMLSTMKRRRVFGAAFTSDTPFGFGNNFTRTIAAPASITAVVAATNVYSMFEVPLAYSDMDLRGGIYANVVNATMQLQLTVNPNLLIASGADPTLAMYQSSSATLATMPSYTVNVYQNFLDQLPISQQGGPVLPVLDMSTAYLLNNTSLNTPVANQDNPIPYANFRDFMSTTLIYDNAGTLNVGTDVSYFAITSANYTNLIKYDPNLSSLLSRLIGGDDPPKGTYYFDHRNKPINTIQYGNMQLIINPTTVSSGSPSVLLGYEALALINNITQAGSLYGSP